MVSPEKAVAWYRQRFPEDSNLSDKEIFESYKLAFPNKEYGENPYEDVYKQQNKSAENLNLNTKETDEDRNFWVSAITLNPVEWWANSEWWGSEMAQRAYMKSSIGAMDTIYNGRPRYTSEEESGMIGELAETFLSMANPIDIGAFAASGFVGNVAKNAVSKKVAQYGGKRIMKKTLAYELSGLGKTAINEVDNFALNGIRRSVDKHGTKHIRDVAGRYIAKQMSIEGAIGMGTNLGVYTTGTSFLQREANFRQQVMMGEKTWADYDMMENMAGAIGDGFGSFLTGSLTGGFMKGKMVPAFAKASAAKNPSLQQKATKIATNAFSQYLFEASAFTAGHVGFESLKGEKPTLEGVWESWVHNLGIVGGFKLLGKTNVPILGGSSSLKNDVIAFNKKRRAATRQVLFEKDGTKKYFHPEEIKGDYKLSDIDYKEAQVLNKIAREVRKDSETAAEQIKKSADKKNKSNIDVEKAEDFVTKVWDELSIIADKLEGGLKYKDLSIEEKIMTLHYTSHAIGLGRKTVDIWMNEPEKALEYFAERDYNKKRNELTAEEINDINFKVRSYSEQLTNMRSIFQSSWSPKHRKEMLQLFAKSYEQRIEKVNIGGKEYYEVFTHDINGNKKITPSSQNRLLFKNELDAIQAQKKISEYLMNELTGSKSPDKTIKSYVEKDQEGNDILSSQDTSLVGSKGESIYRDKPTVSKGKVEDVDALIAQGKARELTAEEINNLGPNWWSNNKGTNEVVADVLNQSNPVIQTILSKVVQLGEQVSKITGKKDIADLYTKKDDGTKKSYAETIEDVKKNPTLNPTSKRKKNLIDIVDNSKLDTSTKQIVLEYLSQNKYTLDRMTPAVLKKLVGYWEYLEQKGYTINEATQKLTSDYADKINLMGNAKNTFNDAISYFYGSGSPQGKTIKGFSYDYMEGIRISEPGSRQTAAAGEKDKAVITSESYPKARTFFETVTKTVKDIITKVKPWKGTLYEHKIEEVKTNWKDAKGNDIVVERRIKTNPKTGEEFIQFKKSFTDKDGKQKMSASEWVKPEVLDVVVELARLVGSRGPNLMERLQLKHIDLKRGVITDLSTGKAHKGGLGPHKDLPLKALKPEVWNKIEKLVMEARKRGATDESTLINSYNLKTETTWNKNKALEKPFSNTDNVNRALAYMQAISPVDFRGDFTHPRFRDFRRAMITDAELMGTVEVSYKEGKVTRTDNVNMKEFVDIYVIRHQPGQATTYAAYSPAKAEAAWKAFIAFRATGRETAKLRPEAAREIGEAVLSSKEFSEFISKVQKKNPNIKFEDTQLVRDVVGKYLKGVVSYESGKSQPADVFHELYHSFKDIGRITNNKSINNLVNKAEQLSKNTKEYKEWAKKNAGRDYEEFVADITGGKAARYQYSKGFLNKMNQIVKQISSRVKKFFGVANFNDYARIIAGRVQKGGFAPEGMQYKAGEFKYKRVTNKDTVELQRSVAKGLIDTIQMKARKFNMTPEEFSELISINANISNPYGVLKQFAKDLTIKDFSDSQVESMNRFSDKIDMNFRKMPSKEFVQVMKKTRELTDLENSLGMSAKESIDKLKLIGVRNGLKTNATIKQLEYYSDWLDTKQHVNRNQYSENTRQEMLKDIKIDTEPGVVKKLMQDFKMMVAPIRTSFNSIGLPKIARAFGEHFAIKNTYEQYEQTMISNMRSILGGKKPFVGESIWEGSIGQDIMTAVTLGKRTTIGLKDKLEFVNNSTSGVAAELIFKWKNDTGLTKNQRFVIAEKEKFLRKVVTPKFMNEINQKTFKTPNIRERENPDIDNSPYKYLQKGGKVTEANPNGYSKEAQAVAEYWHTMDAYWGFHMGSISTMGLARAIKAVPGMTESKYMEIKEIVEKGGLRKVKDGFFPRVLSDSAKANFNPGSKAMQAKIEKIAYEYAENIGRQRYQYFDKLSKKAQEDIIYGRNNKTEQLTPYQIGENKAKLDIASSLQYSAQKMTFRSLKNRQIQFPAMHKGKDGKLQFTYEWQYHKTVNPYVIGMSQFLANVQVFPELVKVDAFDFVPTKEYMSLVEFGTNKRATQLKNWTQEQFDKITGNEIQNISSPRFRKFVSGATKTLSKTMLSFTKAGYKNWGLGTAQTMGMYGLSDMANAFGGIIKRDAALNQKFNRIAAVKQELGIYESSGALNKILDKTAFKVGMMTPTENFNRKLSVLSAIYDQQRQIKKIQTGKKGDAQYDQGIFRLKRVYELSDAEISLLKKHTKSENIEPTNFKETQLRIRLEDIENKMNTLAHAKTQGVTGEAFMPAWMSTNNFTKDMLLFKRMAYAATYNTAANTKTAILSIRPGGKGTPIQARQVKNLIRPSLYVLASYATGASLQALFHQMMFGENQIDENSPTWRRILNTLYQGEFLGLLSEFFNPRAASIEQFAENNIYPAIVQNGVLLSQQIIGVSRDTKTVEQATQDYATGTMALYNAQQKIFGEKSHKLQKDSKNFRKLYNAFDEEWRETGKGKTYTSPEFTSSTRSPYTRDLRNTLYHGTPEEFAKEYWMTVMKYASDDIRTYRAASTTEAIEGAKKKVLNILKGTNPNANGTFLFANKSPEAALKAKLFKKWLLRQEKGILYDSGEQIFKDIVESEKEWKEHIQSYTSQINYYTRQYNLKGEAASQFNWTPNPLK